MYVAAWLRAFGLTAAVEVPIVVSLTRDLPVATWRRAMIALFGQLATHPLVWFVFPALHGLTRHQSLWLSEAWAWLGEACLYGVAWPRLPALRAVGVSALANGASLGVGLMLGPWLV